MTKPTHRAGFVTNQTHYKMMWTLAGVALAFAVLSFFAGRFSGSTSSELEASNSMNANLNAVYNEDTLVNKALPDFRDMSDWKKYMRGANPLF